MAPDPKRVQEVILAAASYHESADRASMLDPERLADSELRVRVEALLEAHDQIDDSLKQPRVGLRSPGQAVARVTILGTSLSSESHGWSSPISSLILRVIEAVGSFHVVG
jgi:hypothetical protein